MSDINTTIPISKPFLDDKESDVASEVIKSGWVTQGPKVKKFEEDFSRFVGSKHACAVSSCTTALHLALKAVGVKPGDIVITVSHSYIATANAIRYCGAEPYFVDVERDTFNMSPNALKVAINSDFEKRGNYTYCEITSELESGESPLVYIKPEKQGRLAAILVVHQMGMPCDIVELCDIAKKHNVPVIEDAACAIGSKYELPNGQWQKVGAPYADIACFSFHPRKVLTTGDGGMLTTNNSDYDQEFRLMRQHGMNISDVMRHQSNKVLIEEHIVTGYNYRMTDIQAAIGIEQLKKLPDFLAQRYQLNDVYRELLSTISWLKAPYESTNSKTNWQSFAVTVEDNAPISRNELMQKLKDNGIASKPGVMNSHQEKPYQNYKWQLPNSEWVRENVILLPLYQGLKNNELQNIKSIICH